jgi:hypothetical protein
MLGRLIRICALLLLAGCGTTQPKHNHAVELTLPDLPRQIHTEDWPGKWRNGVDYEPGLTHRGVDDPTRYELEFSGGSGVTAADFAVATYLFTLEPTDDSTHIFLHWRQAPEPGRVWIALANWGTNRWNLFRADSAYVDIGGSAPYRRAGDNACAAAVLVNGSSLLDLHYIALTNPDTKNIWNHSLRCVETDAEKLAFDALAVGAQDELYMGGYATGPQSKQAVIARLSPTGQPLWARNWSCGNNGEGFAAVAIDAGGNVWAAANLTNPTTFDDFITLVKLSPAGDLLFETAYALLDTDFVAHDMVIADGKIYVAGTVGSFTTSSDVLLLAFDDQGALAGQVAYDYDTVDEGLCLLEDQGWVLVGGYDWNDPLNKDENSLLLQFDGNLQLAAQKQLNPIDKVMSIASDSGGFYWIAGDYKLRYVGKVDSTTLDFMQGWTAGAYQFGQGVVPDGQGGVYACGGYFVHVAGDGTLLQRQAMTKGGSTLSALGQFSDGSLVMAGEGDGYQWWFNDPGTLTAFGNPTSSDLTGSTYDPAGVTVPSGCTLSSLTPLLVGEVGGLGVRRPATVPAHFVIAPPGS